MYNYNVCVFIKSLKTRGNKYYVEDDAAQFPLIMYLIVYLVELFVCILITCLFRLGEHYAPAV